MKLKLIQYNIWHGHYLDRVIDFLKQEDADVLCLQEVATKGKSLQANEVNIYEEIKKELDLHAVYSSKYEIGGTDFLSWDMGVAIYSKKKIITSSRVLVYAESTQTRYQYFSKDIIPTTGGKLLVTEIQGIPVPIATTHFTWTPDASVSDGQRRSLANLLEATEGYSNLILAGDFNTLYDSEIHQGITQQFTDATEALADKGTLHPVIHPVGDKGFHVDYVFYRGDTIKHLYTKIPVVDASDHLPVVCEFEVNDSTTEKSTTKNRV